MSSNKRVHCCFCPALGKRNDDFTLSINWPKGIFYCFRCGTSGRVDSLPPNFKQPLILKEDKQLPESLDFGKMISLGDSEIGKSYFRIRGLRSEPLENFVFVSGKKLVFPFYDSEGNIVYYVARKMWGSGRRYDNKAAAIKDIYIPLGIILPCRRTFIITEGIFDALSVWQWLKIPCIALLGMNINAFKIRRILECTCNKTHIIILLDSGEYKTAQEYFIELKPLRKNTTICKLEEGDPNETGKEKLWTSLMPYLSFDERKIFSNIS